MLRNTVNKDAYLSKDFKPEKTANALLRETVAPQDISVDISPALTRLKYDLEEIDREMETICKENTDVLLNHSEKTETLHEELEKLRPAKENMTSTYAKLEHDFLEPYNQATRLNNAGIKLYSVAQLSRSLSWYLQLALQAQSQEYRRESVISSGGAGPSLLRTAHALIALHKLVSDVPDLAKVHAVEQFERKVPQLKEAVIESCTKMLRDFDLSDSSQMRMAASALVSLGVDLLKLIESHTRALVGSTVLQLSRNSASAVEHERAFEEAHKRASIVSTLLQTYREVTPKQHTASEIPEPRPYWAQVATQLDQKLKTMSVANPTALRSMVANRDAILASTRTVDEVHAVFAKYINT